MQTTKTSICITCRRSPLIISYTLTSLTGINGLDLDEQRSPLGVTPVKVAQYQRESRYQILPACTQDGIILFRVFQGSTDSAVFDDPIDPLLHHCDRHPEQSSMLVIDNASFHRTKPIEQMYANARVKLMYLPPYSPDLKSIEECFAN